MYFNIKWYKYNPYFIKIAKQRTFSVKLFDVAAYVFAYFDLMT